MAITPWIPQVIEVNNGQQVDAATVNAVTDQLVQREQHLYEKFDQISNKSVLMAFSQPINPDELPPNEQVIQEGYLYVVYYANDPATGKVGVKRAISEFTNSTSTSFFTPANSCYSFGVVENVNTNNTVDVYLEGLVTFNVPINDSTYGMLDYVSSGVRETFRPGPYYLSRKTPGLITSDPSGITVFVGYALDVNTMLLKPGVNEFSQLFANYQYDILDRPTGTPVLDVPSQTYSIPTSTLGRLGWVDVNYLPSSYTIPAGAKFIYNIPATFTVDNGDDSLSPAEEAQAAELRTLLPPDPANFVVYTTNGVAQRFVSAVDTDGIYSIDQYGIWWYDNNYGYQPWSSDLPEDWVPADWPTTKGSPIDRPRMYLQFAKFNPNLKNAVVTSIGALTTDGSGNNLKFLNKYDATQTASTGDVVVDFTLPIPSPTLAASSNIAITSATFNQSTGAVVLTTAPMVSGLISAPNSGISITETPTGSGKYTLGFQNQGITGSLDSLQPINSDFEYLGINSFIRLRNVFNPSYGYIGKILLPKLFPSGQALKIVVHAFGTAAVSGTAQNAGFSFEYSVSTAQNGNAPAAVKTINSTPTGAMLTTTTSTTTGGPSLFNFPINYVANEVLVFQTNEFVIPAANVGEDSIVNFKVLRQTVGANAYPGDVGVLDIYWSLV